MGDSAYISRRGFLYGVALAAGSAALASCSSSGGSTKSAGGTANGSGTGKAGSATEPLPIPASFSEAPALKGKGLPAVKDRLPENPLVLPHNWVERGKYGGTLNLGVLSATGMASASASREFYYGMSPTRWLNDGLDIGPGLADHWSSNQDASEWTIHFRKGLKWSDGHPFTVDDIIFWYEDIAKPGHNAQTPPPDTLSAKGTPCTMTKVDDSTLKMTYDAPQPLVPDYLAAWVKGNIGQNGPVWMYPKHYMKQFHPKYNKSVPKDWDSVAGLWEQKGDWLRNPDCPTMTGYRCKSFDNNKGAVLERNPYYYVVTKDGDQLPYIDNVNITLYQTAEVAKLTVQQGKVDFCHGPFNQITLSDVSTLNSFKDKANFKVILWDSGSGTGEMFMLNLDYPEKKYRDLFNDKRFRKAISHASDRKTVNKTLYFETGEITTGTMSAKALEYHVKPNGPSMYKSWRDSAKDYDVKKAKALFAELGLKDVNNDGYLEFPDGSKLTVELPYSADASKTAQAADDQLVSDMKKAGLRMVRRPVPPQSFGDQWTSGQLMARTNWDLGDGPNFLVYPQQVVPLDNSRWAPLQGNWYAQAGTGKTKTELSVDPWKRHPPRREPEADSPIAELVKIYNQTKLEPDETKRHQLVWKIIKIHIDEGPFFMGSTSNYPQVVTSHVDLRNVPETEDLAQHGFVNPWVVPAPAVYDPECWFWTNPDQHT